MEANKTLVKLAKKIDKLNAELKKYCETTEQWTLPSVDSTFISIDDVELYKYTMKKTMLVVTDCDGDTFRVRCSSETDAWELDESIKYTKRRIAKGWRMWKSENPDWELEHDKDEDDE